MAMISSLKRNDPMTTKKNGILVLESKQKGFAITRVPLGQTVETYISNPVKGMLIYDENSKCLKLYDGSVWSCLKQKALPYNP